MAKYKVTLTDDERDSLRKLVSTGTRNEKPRPFAIVGVLMIRVIACPVSFTAFLRVAVSPYFSKYTWQGSNLQPSVP
jgi:hypothetical protein